jgi:hypothetical protein
MRNAYRILVRKPGEKKILGKPTRQKLNLIFHIATEVAKNDNRLQAQQNILG